MIRSLAGFSIKPAGYKYSESSHHWILKIIHLYLLERQTGVSSQTLVHSPNAGHGKFFQVSRVGGRHPTTGPSSAASHVARWP